MALLTIANPDLRFGSDYSTFKPSALTFPGGGNALTWGLTYNRIYGPRVPLEGVVRRWLVDKNGMLWAPDAGFSVYKLLNSRHDTRRLAMYKEFLQREATDVDFVRSATVRISYVGTALTINATISLTLTGNHTLNVGVDQAGNVLAQFPTASA